MVKDKTYFINRIPIPETKNDHYLFYLINGGVFEDLPQPHSKLEHYLYNLCWNKASNKTRYMKMMLNSQSEGQNYASTIFDLGNNRVNSARVKFRFCVTNDGIDFPKNVRVRLFADNESDQNNIVVSNRSYMYDSNVIEGLSPERIYEIEAEYPFSINGHKLSEFRYLKPYLMLNKKNVGYGSTHSIKLYRVELIIGDKIHDITTTAKDYAPLDKSSVRYIDEKHGEDGTVWTHGIADPTLDTNGNEGDFYLNTTSGNVFVKLGNGNWSNIGLTLKGTQGEKGKDGKNGIDGKTWKPSVDGLGNLTWVLNNEESAPQSVNIKGAKGDNGEKGADGTSVKILGSYDTEEALKQAHPDNNAIGDGYIVGENLIIWDGTQWKNVGKIKGEKGNDGKNGIDGKDGNKLWVISIVPIDTVGNDGDVAINKTKWDVYFKEGGTWVLQGNIKGEQGLQGVNGKDGNTWHSGEVQPQNTIGNDGDFYLDTLTFKVYKKENNAWVQKGIIKGDNGQQGLAGKNGTKWHIGDTTPSATIGVEGDYYLSKDTWTIYVKGADGIWKDQGSIKGEQGEQGEAGVSGTSGGTTVVKGEKGEDGKTWKPSVSDTGELSWVLDDNTTQPPTTINIKGKDGAKGVDGTKWFNGSGVPNGTNTANSKVGDYYLDVTKGDVYTKGADDSWDVIGNIKGKDGANGTGTTGTVGQSGKDGKDGSVWFNGVEDPTQATTTIAGAKQGDYYLNNNTGNYYYYDGSKWTSKGVLKGQAGAKGQNGARGSKWFSDATEPNSSNVTTDKALGDYYLDTTNGKYYEYDGSKWNEKGTLTGGTGSGTATVVGQKGEKGEDGTKWHTGDGDPKALQIQNVKDGDLFLDNESGNYYEYDGATWNEKGSLKGIQGEVGPKGETGPAGPQGPKGADGTGVTILGSYDSEDALIKGQPTGKPGDSYLVQGNLYVWDGTKWKNVGTIQGPKGDRGLQGETGPQGPQGLKGETGPQGPIGQTGPKGADGVSIKSITQTTTSTADGGTNVITVATSDGKSATFSVKNGTKGEKGDTGLTGSQGERGLQGPKGDKGATWFTGDGLPSEKIKGQGVVGDYYLNSVDGFVYRKNANNDNGWVKTTVDLTGPVGATGPTGLQGKAGTNGNRWLNGSGTPTSTNPSGAVTGDYFLQNSTGKYWQKQSDGEWKSLGVLKGADGQDGATGKAGANGEDGTKWYVGNGLPTASGNTATVQNSKNGDYFLDKSTGNIYKRGSVTWDTNTVVANIKGNSGKDGTPGAKWFFGTKHPTDSSMATRVANAKSGDFFLDWTVDTPTPGAGTPIYQYNGTNWSAIGRGYVHAKTHPADMITLTGVNKDKNVQTFIDQGGTIGGPTKIDSTLEVSENVTTGRIKGNSASGSADSIYVGNDNRQARISTGSGGIALWTTPHTASGQNSGIHVADQGSLKIYNGGQVKHTLDSSGNANITGTLTTGNTITATNGNIVANNGQVMAKGNVSSTGGEVIGSTGVFANSGNVEARNGNVRANGTLIGDRLQGNSKNSSQIADRVSFGTGNCRFDTNEGIWRLWTTAFGGKDYGLRMYTSGQVEFVANSIQKHQFLPDGQKVAGSMEIEGTVYGMSPMDSPQAIIEYVEYDVVVKGEQVIKLNEIYSKMVSKYAVFSSNPDIKIIKKEAKQFIVQGDGIADFNIKGQRKGGQTDYQIMGGINHGTTKEQSY